MKATVTEDDAGLRWEIKDDGSEEYRKAVELTCKVKAMSDEKNVAEPSGASGGYGVVAALIQTDSSGKVAGIRHQERDSFPPNELIPLYLCPQLTVSKKEQQAIKIAIEWLTTLSSRRREIHSADLLLQDARTLSGLLQRIR